MKKPLIIYFHRYAIEYEIGQFSIVRRIIDMLLQKGYDVAYFSMKSKKLDEKLRKGIKILSIPLTVNNKSGLDKWFKTIFYYLYLPITLIRLKKENPSFIICKETMPFIPFLVKLLNVPMMIDTSDWWWSILLGKNKIGRKFANLIESIEVKRWNSKNVVVIVHTNAEARLAEEKGVDRRRIVVINAPMDNKTYFPINASQERKNLGLTKNDFVVAIHGIIHPSKGYDQLLRWWKKVSLIHPNFKLLIIGGSIGEKWCRKEIKRLNLEKSVVMTGWLPTHSEVNCYLNSADCLLITRRNTPENFGVIPSSLYHSLPLGKPTLITGLPGMSEIIKDRVNGYLYRPDDYDSFKNALEEIYENPKKSKNIGKKGVVCAKKFFNPEKSAKSYIRVISNFLH